VTQRDRYPRLQAQVWLGAFWGARLNMGNMAASPSHRWLGNMVGSALLQQARRVQGGRSEADVLGCRGRVDLGTSDYPQALARVPVWLDTCPHISQHSTWHGRKPSFYHRGPPAGHETRPLVRKPLPPPAAVSGGSSCGDGLLRADPHPSHSGSQLCRATRKTHNYPQSLTQGVFRAIKP
jgi:hypothetical protein